MDVLVQKADSLAQEVPELQIAGGWEEALGKAADLLCPGTPLLLGTIDKKPIVVSYMQALQLSSPATTSNMVIYFTLLFYSCIRKVQ